MAAIILSVGVDLAKVWERLEWDWTPIPDVRLGWLVLPIS